CRVRPGRPGRCRRPPGGWRGRRAGAPGGRRGPIWCGGDRSSRDAATGRARRRPGASGVDRAGGPGRSDRGGGLHAPPAADDGLRRRRARLPGGGVDPQDHDPAVPWRGHSAAEWGRTLGLPTSAARAHVCAAVRETFEECGVLLATPQDGADPPDPALLAADRRRLITGRTRFGRLLAARGLVLRSDLLRPWAHFVTPGWYPRRYDTRFFLARLPHRQQALHLGGEAAESRWWTPAEALAQGLSGE